MVHLYDLYVTICSFGNETYESTEHPILLQQPKLNSFTRLVVRNVTTRSGHCSATGSVTPLVFVYNYERISNFSLCQEKNTSFYLI